jgi:hypothetical protein
MMENDILEDPSASYWLKQLIQSTKTRDSVDVLNDLDLLKSIIEKRLQSST